MMFYVTHSIHGISSNYNANTKQDSSKVFSPNTHFKRHKELLGATILYLLKSLFQNKIFSSASDISMKVILQGITSTVKAVCAIFRGLPKGQTELYFNMSLLEGNIEVSSTEVAKKGQQGL